MNRRTLVQRLVRAPLGSASGPAGDFRPKGFSVHQYRTLTLLCQQIIAADETSGAIGIRYLPSLGNRAMAEFVGCRLCQTEKPTSNLLGVLRHSMTSTTPILPGRVQRRQECVEALR